MMRDATQLHRYLEVDLSQAAIELAHAFMYGM